MPEERLLRLCSCAGKLEMRTTQHWCGRHDALSGSIQLVSWESMTECSGWDVANTLGGQQALGSRLGLYTREFGRSARRSRGPISRFLPVDWRAAAPIRSIHDDEVRDPWPWDQLDLGF